MQGREWLVGTLLVHTAHYPKSMRESWQQHALCGPMSRSWKSRLEMSQASLAATCSKLRSTGLQLGAGASIGMDLLVWPRCCQVPSTLRVWHLEGLVAFPGNGPDNLDVPAVWNGMGVPQPVGPSELVLTGISPCIAVLR